MDGDGYNPSPLHIAAYHGQLGTFQTLLDLGADIHYRDPEGGTLLHSVARGCWKRNNAYLASDSGTFRQHEHEASESLGHQHEEIALKLIGLGLDPMDNRYSVLKDTPLTLTVERGNLKVVQALLNDKGIEIEHDLESLDPNLSRQIKKQKAREEPHLLSVSYANRAGETAFHKVALAGHLDVLKYLYKHAISEEQGENIIDSLDINVLDKSGYSPLAYAVYGDHPDVVDYLISIGADINCKVIHSKSIRAKTRNKGYQVQLESGQILTLVQLACCAISPRALQVLIKHGLSCDVYATTRFGDRVGLMSLAWLSTFDAYRVGKNMKRSSSTRLNIKPDSDEYAKLNSLVSVVAEQASDINDYLPGLQKIKRTMVHCAIYWKQNSLLLKLVSNPRVNLEIKDHDGKNALQIVMEPLDMRYFELLPVLITHGANVNIPLTMWEKTKTVTTPLARAVKTKKSFLVKMLLKKGAHNDENMTYTLLPSAELKTVYQDEIPDDIIQMLLLTDHSLKVFYDIHIKSTRMRYLPKETRKAVQDRQSLVLTLKRHARRVIRNQLMNSDMVKKLPLPTLMKDFLCIPELNACTPVW